MYNGTIKIRQEITNTAFWGKEVNSEILSDKVEIPKARIVKKVGSL